MSKPILVLNCGSSSIKYQMIDAESEELLAKGGFYAELYQSQFADVNDEAV